MARQYSAGTDLINLGTSNTLDPTSKTISIWFTSGNVGSTSFFDAICSRNNAGTHAYDIYIDATTSNRIGWFWVNGSNAGSLAVSPNTWTHLALVLDNGGGTAKGYINGTQDFSGSYTYTLVSTTTTYIGADPNNSNFGSHSTGSLADFALWNTPLSAGNITSLANGVRPVNVNSANLVAWLPLDGYASPETDLSGNGFTGTLTGTARSVGPPQLWHVYGS